MVARHSRRPTWTETALLVMVAVMLTWLLTQGEESMGMPALASGGAAGSLIAATGQDKHSDIFYLVDTTKQRVLVYRWNNPGLRLVSARAYDYDLEVLDSYGDKQIEGVGASRGYVKKQVEDHRRAQERLKNR